MYDQISLNELINEQVNLVQSATALFIQMI